MNDDTVAKWVEHDLINQRVKDKTTGCVGTLKAVAQYISRETDRVVRSEAYVRSDTGYEWPTDPKNLVRADDQAPRGRCP